MCLVLLFGLCARPLVASPLLSIDPVSSTVAAGSSFFLDINISDVTDLYGFQFDVSYDPTKVAAIDIVQGAFFPDDPIFVPGFIDNIVGTITFTAGALVGPVEGISGSGTLARLSLLAMASGFTPLGLTNIVLLDSVGNSIDAAFRDGSVNVTTVPEPASGLLLISGLAAAWRARRRLMPV